ncbi:hypothetical protein EPUS_06216 [Endocarpon pusillum Z07020]|uniref:tRNA (guanine(10)-N(2))-methyltransferase n=1 Tax=Endocarpon pusillum (strain Z07020 / HMAS-L-300199) TaxID=1263415 RepID=U1GT56_ENDPU|nr:uncharacterized protein EPUS_06216 [Endocarpon pusillum Z07020]ERF75176.1 hypothetical protein EPUS_06216 [Endocarpon pusillum Z07020]
MSMDYLIRLVQMHEDFRLAEIRCLASYFRIEIDIVSYSKNSPFLILRILSYPASKFTSPNVAAKALISRSVLSLGIHELWGMAPKVEGVATYAALHADVQTRTNSGIWAKYKKASFRFSVDAYCGKRSPAEQTEIINGFRYLGFEGPIRMQNPEVEFTAFEEWNLSFNPNHSRKQHPDLTSQSLVDEPFPDNHPTPQHDPQTLYFGRLISSSPRHHLIMKHDLKRRPYISTTSMDATLALVSANLAHAGPGRMLYDPFVGTGGFLVAAAELGACVWGSDIDGRSFRGAGRGKGGSDGKVGKKKGGKGGVWRNFEEYGLGDLFGDCFICDLINTPLRTNDGNGWLDGIICDPPYGVREGLRILGNREPRTDRIPIMVDGVPAHTLPGYVAPKKPYSFERMLDDILAFAADTLVTDGRLAFWMPSANEDDEELAIPKRVELELVECCVQRFHRWSRRLLVYRRRRKEELKELDVNGSGQDDEKLKELANGKTASDLNPFRRKYFQGFRTRDIIPTRTRAL